MLLTYQEWHVIAAAILYAALRDKIKAHPIDQGTLQLVITLICKITRIPNLTINFTRLSLKSMGKNHVKY